MENVGNIVHSFYISFSEKNGTKDEKLTVFDAFAHFLYHTTEERKSLLKSGGKERYSFPSLFFVCPDM